VAHSHTEGILCLFAAIKLVGLFGFGFTGLGMGERREILVIPHFLCCGLFNFITDATRQPGFCRA
jgi:hypothetical protein